MTPTKQKPEPKLKPANFRLALRVEGMYWNAYIAGIDSMKDSILIGSILMSAVQDPDRKARFIGLMEETISVAIKDILGVDPIWNTPPRPAPESERGGNA